MSKIKDRTGETRVNNDGEEMKIIRYGNKNDIDVRFDDGTVIKNRTYEHFKKGNIKNPMTPSVYGVGCIGVGDYKTCDENGKHTKCYATWKGIHRRCYDSKYQEKNQTYKGCSVCKEWNNYQNYAIWHIENYYEVGDERMELDKDILCKGNKVYSAKNCVFVPQSINKLFIKSDKVRGDLPIGVIKNGNKFQAKLNKGNGKQIALGTYTTPELAFEAYKIAKEAYIKEVAEEYKDKIPCKLYEAMVAYKVEIDD